MDQIKFREQRFGDSDSSDNGETEQADLPEGINAQPVEDFGVVLTVSEDKLSAYMSLSGESFTGVTLNDVLSALEREGIKFGVIDNELIKTYLESEPVPDEPFRIAEGKAPISGKDSEIKYNFETDPLNIGSLRKDGTIDWKDRGALPQVRQGDLLAEKIHGTAGTPGTDIYGMIIPVALPRDVKLKCGKGVEKSEDGDRVFSKLAGIPSVFADGSLNVFPEINIQGDIGLETGHVDFDGHIEVAGAVQSGYRVQGKSLRARKLHNAEVLIDEDIIVLGGIYDTEIKCKGKLKAGHIHSSTVDVIGDLVVENEIYGSRIETNGRCMVGGGTIISSEISARKGIVVRNIGTEASGPSILEVGVDRKLHSRIKEIKQQIKKINHQEEEIKSSSIALKERSDQLNIKLGEIAQTQDGYMVQQRQVEEKIKKAQARLNEAEKEKYQTIIDRLVLKQERVDAEINKIIEEDEAAMEKISENDEEIKRGHEEIVELREKIAMIEESAKIDKGVPVVKVSGDIFPGTSITGPNSSVTTKEIYSYVRIFETSETDQLGTKNWCMKISRF